jgi:hypothetical protein
MAVQDLENSIHTLTPEEQESVAQFVEFLRQRRQSGASPFLAAADEFIKEHPELLQRLAQ